MEEKLRKILNILYKLTNDRNILYIKSSLIYSTNYSIIKSNLLIYMDTKLLEMIISNLCIYYFSEFDINLEYYYLYNYDIILTERGVDMKNIYNIDIPYGYREKYVDAIYEINKNIEEEGVVFLFINNIPYNLQSFLYIETSNVEIINIINKYKLKQLTYGKNMFEYIKQMASKSWNSIGLSKEMGKEQINL